MGALRRPRHDQPRHAGLPLLAALALWALPAPRLSSAAGSEDAAARERCAVLGRSAEPQDPEAQAALAACYERGWGVTQDVPRAAALYESCARRGVLACQSMIAGLYRSGYGVPRDLVRARRWYAACAPRDAGCARQLRDLGGAKVSTRGATPALVVKTGAATAPVAAAPASPPEGPAPWPEGQAPRPGLLARLTRGQLLLLGAGLGLGAAAAFLLLR